jgi:hypothetical protein
VSKVYAELKIAQQPNVVDNIAKLFGFSRGNSGNCRQFVVFSTLQLFMRFAYFMACGHLCAALTYGLRPLMVFDHLCTARTEHSFAAYALCSLMRVAYGIHAYFQTAPRGSSNSFFNS